MLPEGKNERLLPLFKIFYQLQLVVCKVCFAIFSYLCRGNDYNSVRDASY